LKVYMRKEITVGQEILSTLDLRPWENQSHTSEKKRKQDTKLVRRMSVQWEKNEKHGSKHRNKESQAKDPFLKHEENSRKVKSRRTRKRKKKEKIGRFRKKELGSPE